MKSVQIILIKYIETISINRTAYVVSSGKWWYPAYMRKYMQNLCINFYFVSWPKMRIHELHNGVNCSIKYSNCFYKFHLLVVMCWFICLGRKRIVFLKVWWYWKNSARNWQPLPLSSTIIHLEDVALPWLTTATAFFSARETTSGFSSE